VTGSADDSEAIRTARLLVRPPREADRDRFDHMIAVCRRIRFGKQPVVELSSGLVVGYTGVDYIEFEGTTRLEWGYRLAPKWRPGLRHRRTCAENADSRGGSRER
jgi:hypothetical protein